jgi:hypothetical protein
LEKKVGVQEEIHVAAQDTTSFDNPKTPAILCGIFPLPNLGYFFSSPCGFLKGLQFYYN